MSPVATLRGYIGETTMSVNNNTNTSIGQDRIAAYDHENGDTVVIAGSRGMPFSAMPDKCIEETQVAVAKSGFTVGEVVCGAARGADRAGAALAQLKGLDLIVEEPREDRYGRKRYHERNSRMVEQADAVIAIWDGDSPGTADTIGKAREELGDNRVYVHPLGDVDVDVTDVEPREL